MNITLSLITLFVMGQFDCPVWSGGDNAGETG